MTWRRLALAAGGLAVAACTTAPRLAAPEDTVIEAKPAGFSVPIRGARVDPRPFEAIAAENFARVKAASDGSIDILALSGGGAGGAFGAGALVGMTQGKHRPRFEMVTGVSTGALIAPFAFLGPAWDDQLTRAFDGESTSDLLTSRGVGMLFDVGVFQGEPLRRLVDKFVTTDLIDAVAKEAATGRTLLVATTNLDTEETQIWDMGAIAMQGGEKSRTLFRDVLVASASVPAIFPPVLIDVTEGDRTFQEMHVDGGATTPFVVAPDSAILGYSKVLRGAHIYIVINGQLASPSRTTPNNTAEIAARGFTAMLNHMARSEILKTSAFAIRNDMTLVFTAIPPGVTFGGALAFGAADMKSIFDYGVRCGASNRLWTTPTDTIAQQAEAMSMSVMAPADAACPRLLPGKLP